MENEYRNQLREEIIGRNNLAFQIREIEKQLNSLEESYHFRNGRISKLEELARQKDEEIKRIEELKEVKE